MFRYTASSTKLECVTQPYPGSYESFTSLALQALLITNGVYYKSTSSHARFRYHWYFTPQV